MTSKEQISPNGEGRSTSCQGDLLARLSRSLERERETRMTVSSGMSLYERYGKSSPLGSLLRMFMESSRWWSPARLLTWKEKTLYSERLTRIADGSPSDTSSTKSSRKSRTRDTKPYRSLFLLVPSERPTKECESGLSATGLMPTPRANHGANITERRAMASHGDLEEYIARNMLPTPMASDAKQGEIISDKDKYVIAPGGTIRKINGNGTDGSIGLGRLVRLLPTPTAQDLKRRGPGSNQQGLPEKARDGLLPAPTAVSWKDGTEKPMRNGKERGELNHLVAREAGRLSLLSPLFVEEMMAFPEGWTALPFLSGEKRP